MKTHVTKLRARVVEHFCNQATVSEDCPRAFFQPRARTDQCFPNTRPYLAHKEYLDVLRKEITKGFVYAYSEQAEALFQNYLDHAEAFVNKTKVKDRNTKEELQPDEGFLKSIEEQIAIIGSAAEGFRQEVIAYLWAASRRGERVSYRSYEPLKEAIEKKLMTSVRDISRIITKARTRDEEQEGKYDAIYHQLSQTDTDPAGNLDLWLSSGGSHVWNPGQARPATDWERQIDDLMRRQARSLDEAERHRLFADVQRVFAEHRPALTFAVPHIYLATSARVRARSLSVQRPQLLWDAETLAVDDTPGIH